MLPLAREPLEAQAAVIAVPIRFGATTWPGYREEFDRAVGEGIAATGARGGVFDEINIDDQRGLVDAVGAEAGAKAAPPLWHRNRRRVVDKLLGVGFEGETVDVRDGAAGGDAGTNP